MEWISVNDRLPEYERPVLGYDSEIEMVDIVNYISGKFFDLDGIQTDVTHWMPLPEPPKERM